MIWFTIALAQPKIIGGGETADHPATVMLNAGGVCGGTVIAPHWLLTTAACFGGTDFDQTGPDGNTVVLVGPGGESGFLTEGDAAEVILHPRHVSRDVSLNSWALAGEVAPDGQIYAASNDLALVRVLQPFSTDPGVLNHSPVEDPWLQADYDMAVVGYGIIERDGAGSGRKRQTQVVLTSYSEPPPTGGWTIGSQMTSQCWGDAGGSVWHERIDGERVLVGVVTSRDCEHTVATRVDPYLDWIRSHVPELQTAWAAPPGIACVASGGSMIGAGPVEVDCVATVEASLTLESVMWEWGQDASTAVQDGDLLVSSHTFEQPGVHEIEACFGFLEGQTCVRSAEPVTVCAAPDAVLEVAIEGARVSLIDRSTAVSPDCVDSVEWRIFAEDETEALFTSAERDATTTLPGPGSYRVVLEVEGIGGVDETTTSVEVEGRRGCSTSNTAPLLGLSLLLPVLALRRRGSLLER